MHVVGRTDQLDRRPPRTQARRVRRPACRRCGKAGGLAPRTRATASDLTAGGQGFDIPRPPRGSLNFPGVFQTAGCQASKNTGSAHSAGA